MLFYFGNYLHETLEFFSFLRLVDSIIFRALSGALTSLVLTILLGDRVILYMYKIGHRDIPRDYLNFSVSRNNSVNPVKTYGGPLLVGAIFVGSMQTSWEGLITPPYSKTVKNYDYKGRQIRLKKGDELGRFNMGSTVIILMPNDFPKLSLEEAQVLNMGQSITQ